MVNILKNKPIQYSLFQSSLFKIISAKLKIGNTKTKINNTIQETDNESFKLPCESLLVKIKTIVMVKTKILTPKNSLFFVIILKGIKKF